VRVASARRPADLDASKMAASVLTFAAADRDIPQFFETSRLSSLPTNIDQRLPCNDWLPVTGSESDRECGSCVDLEEAVASAREVAA
jgi:hypothetical protein